MGKSQIAPIADLYVAILDSNHNIVDHQPPGQAEPVRDRDLLRALMDNLPDMIYFKDRQSRFLKCSNALFERTGAKNIEEMLGKTDFDFFTEEHARPAFEDEQEIIRTGRPLLGKVEKEVFKNNRESWVLTSKIPLRNETGEIIGTFGISKDITPIKEAEAKLEQVHKQLLEASRQAGMAEVATSVLHNVGNVLNSVNVASFCVAESLKKSKTASLSKVVALLHEHEADLGNFFTNDPKGKQLPGYLSQLAGHLAGEQAAALDELALLQKNIEHIKEIVAMQQNYARTSGVPEQVGVVDLVEDAFRMNTGAMERHHVNVVRDYPAKPVVLIEKHKVLQILVNLIRNAKYACDDSGRQDKQIILRVANGNGSIKISVIDNGVGIPAENMARIFNHGFTTRENGHGFGLHSGALAAKEIGGNLIAFSEGPGRGATFTLELPVQQKGKS
jgi:PAS domain S-box-containing protein